MTYSSTRQRLPPLEEQRPVNFYGIELETPARAFWQSLARLLFTMAAAARRRGEMRR